MIIIPEHIAQPERKENGKTVIHPGLTKDCPLCTHR